MIWMSCKGLVFVSDHKRCQITRLLVLSEFLRFCLPYFRYHMLGFNWHEKVGVSKESCRELLNRIGLENWELGKTKVRTKRGAAFILYIALTLMLLVANFANTQWCKKPEKWLKPLHMGTHLRVLSESILMSTNMTGFRCFSEHFAFYSHGQN